MCLDDAHSSFRLAGKVVEIVEDGGHRRVKLALEPWALLDFGPDDLKDLHLGERLGLEAALVTVVRGAPDIPHDHGRPDAHAPRHAHPHFHDTHDKHEERPS